MKRKYFNRHEQKKAAEKKQNQKVVKEFLEKKEAELFVEVTADELRERRCLAYEYKI